jgi:chemotaxis protein methyltransferase WspC
VSEVAPAEARRCFEKALYLQPDHTEALAHFMLLCQQAGDTVQVERLRRRLQRAAAGGKQ